jgi:hypothetical protein
MVIPIECHVEQRRRPAILLSAESAGFAAALAAQTDTARGREG